MVNPLNHGTFIPLYYQLKEIIEKKIETGEWKPGDKIPSENDLRTTYNVSRNTVQKALNDLVTEGLLERIQGRGTFISKPKIEQSLTSFYSFSKVMEKKGMNPKDILLNLDILTVPNKIAKELQINVEEKVVTLQRIRTANKEPIILETSYIPSKLVPGLRLEDIEASSLYGLLENKYEIIVSKAVEAFEPVLASKEESKYLQIEEGAPCLLLDRTAYDIQGNPVEFCRSIVRGDRCRFYTELL
nr:GntR family transcriptional regulator [Fredinandcohnia onubensis]